MSSDASAIDTRVIRALGHPTRVRILAVLQERELVSPIELSTELGIPLGTIGYHVRRLEALGFIELATRTQRRGAVEHHYRAREALDLPRRPRLTRGAGGAAAAQIAHDAQLAVSRGGFDRFAARAERRVVVLDGGGRERLAAAIGEWSAAIERIEQASERRIAERGTRAAHACTAVVMSFVVADDDAAALG